MYSCGEPQSVQECQTLGVCVHAVAPTIKCMCATHLCHDIGSYLSSSNRCCFFDLVPTANCGKPRYFISHDMSMRLVDLLALLVTHFTLVTSADEAAQTLVFLVRALRLALHSESASTPL